MPIRKEMRDKYPPDWPAIVERIRARAGDECEWCGVPNHVHILREGDAWNVVDDVMDLPEFPFRRNVIWVVCTTAHLNHDPSDNRDENLAFLCQRCHNRYDAKHRAAGRKERAAQIPGQTSLLPESESLSATGE